MTGIYKASIYHKRLSPAVHEFQYGGYYILFDIDRIEELSNAVFSIDRFNLLSFYRKDHGFRNGTALRQWCTEVLLQAGIDAKDMRIELQTFPRVLGYVFNPVSFYRCYDAEQKMVAAIAEVNNTFGEHHTYVIENPEPGGNILPKQFHVSPFYPVRGEYSFHFSENGVAIHYADKGSLQLTTSIHGRRSSWGTANLIRYFIRYPIFSLWVIFSIHFQALRLLLKGAEYHSKPTESHNTVTYGQ